MPIPDELKQIAAVPYVYNLNGANYQVLDGVADGDAQAIQNALNVMAHPQLFNGASWDRRRNNVDATWLVSAARVATTGLPVLTGYNAVGVLVQLTVSAAPNTAETLTIQLYLLSAGGAQSSVAYSLVSEAGSAIQAGATYTLLVAPGASTALDTALRNKAYAGRIGRSLSGQIVHSAGSSWTYSVVSTLLN